MEGTLMVRVFAQYFLISYKDYEDYGYIQNQCGAQDFIAYHR